MTNEQFDTVLTNRIREIRLVLVRKAREYAGADDRLHNFKAAARMFGGTQESALIGMFAKHMVSVLDIVAKVGNAESVSESMVNEKIGDSINYLILLEACLIEDLAVLNKVDK